jgi:20S proteasome subunit beta 1
VVVGADTRTSVSGYVSNRYATKVSFVLDEEFDVFAMPPSQLQYDSALYKNSDSEKRLTESRRESDSNIISSSTCCISRSGSAADTQNLANIVRQKLHARKITHRVSSTISDVAHLLKNLLNTGSLTASLICSGYDHSLDRGVIYAIDIGGTLMEQDGWACSGSGSSYILGYVDANYPKDSGESPLWSEEEAVEFVGRAIELAMDRDGSSGGFVRIFVINRDGKKQICRLVGSQYENGSEKSGTVNERNLSNFAPPIR